MCFRHFQLASASQQGLVVFIQNQVDLHHIVEPLFDEEADDKVESAAIGQRVSRPADEIFGLLQIQPQGQGQSQGRGLGGPMVRIVANFRKSCREILARL